MIWEAIKMAFASIWANKVRSFLTMLGVVIGIFSVVSLTAAVAGAKKQAEDLITGLGPTTLIVAPWPSVDDATPSFSQGAAGSNLTKDDFESLRKMQNASEFYGVSFVSGIVGANDKKAAPFLIGATKGAEKIFKLALGRGSTLTDNDYASAGKAIVAGEKPLEKLGINPGEAVGKKVKIGKEEYVIRGVYKKSNQFLLGFNLDDIIVMPLEAAFQINKKEFVDRIYFVALSKDKIKDASDEAKTILKDRHSGEEDISILEQKDALSILNNITNILTALLGGIAGISLLVGGIGIMNIMLVSVTERTREIGLRKAVGATDGQILFQFLIEAVVLTLLGALIGLAMAFAAAKIAAAKTPIAPDITLWAVFLASGVSVAVGLVFGLFPAYRAAKKDAIESLRYE